MSYNVEISAFEGPMDLLLHLISNAKIDIYDIPINKITDQFLGYIKKMEDLNLEVASEFIVMASSLVEIKSKMLLPKKDPESNQEEEDPREELVKRILEYQKYKSVSEELKDLETKEARIYYKPREDIFEEEELELEGLDVSLLIDAVNSILKEKNKEEKLLTISEIQREEYSLDQCMLHIKNMLKEEEYIVFSSIMDPSSSKEKIITYFLSLLELTKTRYIRIEQNEDFSDLLILKREG